MPIDLDTEETVPLSKAGRLFPNPQPARAALWRYAMHGCQGVILETMLVGGSRRVTTLQCVRRFLADLNALPSSRLGSRAKASKPDISPKQRRARAEQANQALADAGL